MNAYKEPRKPSGFFYVSYSPISKGKGTPLSRIGFDDKVLPSMKALIQRSIGAKVTVSGQVIGQIGPGLVVFLGIKEGDTEKNAEYLVNKIVNLRVFPGESASSFDRSILEEKKEVLVVSQFTLYGSCKKGRRPDFNQAASPDQAEKLYTIFVQKMKDTGLKVATGQFQAMMQVELTNDGPVTLIIESEESEFKGMV